MHKINDFKNVFNCNLCNQTLVNPIILPCFETVCNDDLKSCLLNSNKFNCPMCEEEHVQPETGFKSDVRIQKMLDMQANQIDFQKILPNFVECENGLKKAIEKINEIEPISRNPENFFYEYFHTIICQIDLQRESLKESIDLYSNQMIQHINGIHQNYIAQKNNKKISKIFYEAKEKANKLSSRFNSFDINDEQIKEIIVETNQLVTQLHDLFKDHERDLLSNKSYSFEPANINIQNYFGILNEVFFHIYWF